MSGFGAGGFAEGFTAGMGAMNQALALRQEREWRQQQAEQEQQRYGERAAMEKERMAGEREDRALNRQLAERRLAIDESMAPVQRAHVEQGTAASKQAAELAKTQAGYAARDQAMQEEKHANEMRKESVAQAKEAMRAWKTQYDMAIEKGEPPPPITPELYRHAEVLHGPRPEQALSPEETQRRQLLAKGLQEGSIPLNDPQVASEVEKLHPWVFQRGIGEPGPNGGKIESKNSLGFEEHEGGKLVPLVQVNVRNDDGSMYSYTAPMTEKGSSDAADGVVTMSKNEAQRSLAGQIMAGKDEGYVKALSEFAASMDAPTPKEALEMRGKRQDLEKTALDIEATRRKLNETPKIDITKAGKEVKEFTDTNVDETQVANRFNTYYPGKASDDPRTAVQSAMTQHISELVNKSHVPEEDAKRIVLYDGVYGTHKGQRGYTVSLGNGKSEFYPVKPPTEVRKEEAAAAAPQQAAPKQAAISMPAVHVPPAIQAPGRERRSPTAFIASKLGALGSAIGSQAADWQEQARMEEEQRRQQVESGNFRPRGF